MSLKAYFKVDVVFFINEFFHLIELAHVKRVLITFANSKSSDEAEHPHSHARAFAIRSHKIRN